MEDAQYTGITCVHVGGGSLGDLPPLVGVRITWLGGLMPGLPRTSKVVAQGWGGEARVEGPAEAPEHGVGLGRPERPLPVPWAV